MSALMAPVLPARAGPRAWRDQAPVSVERAAQHRPAARAGGGQLTGGRVGQAPARREELSPGRIRPTLCASSP